MGLFDRFKRQEEQPKKMFKRSYAAASTSRLFADFATTDRSADAELRPAIKILRARSRELVRNNEYARRYVNLMKNNIVGDRGFTTQCKAMNSAGTLDSVGNDLVEKAFRTWGKIQNCTVSGNMTWVDVQKLVIESVVRDGEAFIIVHRSSKFHDSISLEFVEPDRVDEDYNDTYNGNRVRMGVEFDEFRRPVAYHMLVNHPNDMEYTALSSSRKRTRIPADRVIHVYQQTRTGMSRGEPWMTPVMHGLKQLDGFRVAAVINARVGASKMGFFTSPDGDGFMADDMDNNVPIMEAEPASFHQLPAGVSFQSFDPQYPNGEFDSFNKAMLKGIASGLGVSYTALTNDLEATSYSSIRQGALDERDQYKNLQSFFIDHFVRVVFERWLSAAMEVNSFGIPVARFDKFAEATEFRGRSWSWVDPVKEMNAAVTGLKSGVLSLQDVAAQFGKDAEELLSQIQRDKTLMDQFDVQYALEPYGANFTPVPPEGYTDGEE